MLARNTSYQYCSKARAYNKFLLCASCRARCQSCIRLEGYRKFTGLYSETQEKYSWSLCESSGWHALWFYEFVQNESLHSAAWSVSPKVEEQRRACRRCIREHGPDALIAKELWLGLEGLGGRRKGIEVGGDTEHVPRQLRRLRAPRQGVLWEEIRPLTAVKYLESHQ
jgi:hypothetical protein